MGQRGQHLARLIRWALVAALPVAALAVILVVADALAPGPAILLWVAALIGAAIILQRAQRTLDAIAGYVQTLAERRADSGPGLPRDIPFSEITGAIRRLDRAWQDRADQIRAALAATESIINAIPDALILIDRERVVTRANPAAQAVFGSQVRGRNLAAHLRHPELIAAVDATFAGGGGASRDLDLDLPGATRRHFLTRVLALHAPLPDGSAAIVMLHDITAIKRTDRMRADFVANASHEIRSPLASLVGMIETLRGAARDDPEARERFLAMMNDQAQRITRLVEDLLSLSRIEMAEHSPPSGQVKLDAIVIQASDMLAFKASQRQMRVELDRAPGPCLAIGDERELVQLFLNLIDNAIKYGATNSAVVVAIRPVAASELAPDWPADTPALRVSVRDQGPGIAPEHLPRLTERFYRVDQARSRELGGTGLGLAIVKHIVTRHRGRLTIESRLGEGSRFTVLLPAAKPDQAD